MPPRPHPHRRAPLLIATLLAACRFESAGLGETSAGPNADATTASPQTGDGSTTAATPATSVASSGSVTSSDSDTGGGSGNTGDPDSTGDGPPATCGDDVVDPGEECDGGNDPPCTPVCKLNVCGDGYLGGVEQCDDAGANGDDKGCTSACQNARCGDGLVGPGEPCDDGNASNTDNCLDGCVLPTCGDGFQQIGVETCDLGADNGAYDSACNVTCNGPGPTCGDGAWDPQNEACDGNGAPSGADCKDGCQAECEPGKVDCNGNPNDGCQGLLTDKNNCGVCGKKCLFFCALGVCY